MKTEQRRVVAMPIPGLVWHKPTHDLSFSVSFSRFEQEHTLPDHQRLCFDAVSVYWRVLPDSCGMLPFTRKWASDGTRTHAQKVTERCFP